MKEEKKASANIGDQKYSERRSKRVVVGAHEPRRVAGAQNLEMSHSINGLGQGGSNRKSW